MAKTHKKRADVARSPSTPEILKKASVSQAFLDTLRQLHASEQVIDAAKRAVRERAEDSNGGEPAAARL